MKVTAMVRYDMFPYYTVVEGDLQDNFDVKTSSGTYNNMKVLKVRPIAELEEHENIHRQLICNYDVGLKNLQLDLLKASGVDFTKISFD